MHTRRIDGWLLLSCLIIGCSGGGDESDTSTTEGTPAGAMGAEGAGAMSANAMNPGEAAGTPTPGAMNPASTNAGAGGTSEPSATGTTPAQGTAGAPASPGTPIEPGTAEVLVSDMAFPARFAIAGDTAYVINRTSFLTDPSPDQMVAVTLSTGASRVLFEHSGMAEMALVGNVLWIANQDTGLFYAHDATTGAELESVYLEDETAFRLAADETELYFATRPLAQSTQPGGYGRVWRGSGAAEPSLFWVNEVPEIPNLMRLMPSALITITDGYVPETGIGTSRLMSFPRDGGAESVLAEGELLGDFAEYDGDLLYTDYYAGRVERLPAGGGASQLVAEVDAAWGLTVDGDFAYVTTQPAFWCESTAEGDLLRVDLRSGETVSLATDLPCPSRVAVTADAVYWTNNGFVSPGASGAVVVETPVSDPPSAPAEPEMPAPERGYTAFGGGAFMRMAR